MRLLLIRHGQTPNNVAGILDSAIPGAGLTRLGLTQADAVPAAVATEQIAGLYVSRLVRTQLTAAPLAAARGLEAQVEPGLEEISSGDWEGRADAEAVHGYQSSYRQWVHGDLSHAIPGGEDGNIFLQRYETALTRIAQAHASDATVAVVSHGAAIRVYATLACGLDADEFDERRLRNTAMVVLTGSPGHTWELNDWIDQPLGGAHLSGDTSHDVTADEDADPWGSVSTTSTRWPSPGSAG